MNISLAGFRIRLQRGGSQQFMETWQAFILGIIEGITEYLPISSTGHLVVAQQLMGVGTENSPGAKAAADCFAICIQGGAILAVLGLYLPHVLKMANGMLGRDPEGFKMAMAILVGFMPAAVLGLLLNDIIDAKLMFMWPIIAAWVVGGVGILAATGWRKRNPAPGGGKSLLEMTWKMALVIGLLQCVAMWPGTSRSLMTIVGGLLVGLSVRAAVEYSFLLGVVTLTAATAKKAVWKVDAVAQYDNWFGGARLMWDSYGALPTVVGLAAAAISAAVAVKWAGFLSAKPWSRGVRLVSDRNRRGDWRPGAGGRGGRVSGTDPPRLARRAI